MSRRHASRACTKGPRSLRTPRSRRPPRLASSSRWGVCPACSSFASPHVRVLTRHAASQAHRALPQGAFLPRSAVEDVFPPTTRFSSAPRLFVAARRAPRAAHRTQHSLFALSLRVLSRLSPVRFVWTQTGRYAQRLGAGAPLYLAAVLEYLTAEVLELSGNAVRCASPEKFIPLFFQLFISCIPRSTKIGTGPRQQEDTVRACTSRSPRWVDVMPHCLIHPQIKHACSRDVAPQHQPPPHPARHPQRRGASAAGRAH